MISIGFKLVDLIVVWVKKSVQDLCNGCGHHQYQSCRGKFLRCVETHQVDGSTILVMKFTNVQIRRIFLLLMKWTKWLVRYWNWFRRVGVGRSVKVVLRCVQRRLKFLWNPWNWCYVISRPPRDHLVCFVCFHHRHHFHLAEDQRRRAGKRTPSRHEQ